MSWHGGFKERNRKRDHRCSSKTLTQILNTACRNSIMNNSLKSISSVILGATLRASSAFAIPNPGSAKPDHENWTAPQPTEVVSPVFARSHEGDTVRVRLVIDELGLPSEVVVLTLVDAELKKSIVTAVEQWRFEPATQNGKAVKTHAVLPIELEIDYNS